MQDPTEAENALAALTVILAELGLELEPAKTRIVHLREGGEGVDFLGFHHRWVRGRTAGSSNRVPRSLALTTGDAARPRPCARAHGAGPAALAGREIVGDLNRFLRGWAGYFRYGNSTVQFDTII